MRSVGTHPTLRVVNGGKTNSCRDLAAVPDPVSFREFAETSFRRRMDLVGFKRCFPDRARRYFRSTGLSPAELAVAFGVDVRTARNWLEGVVAPSGDKVAVIALNDPEGFRKHFGEAA